MLKVLKVYSGSIGTLPPLASFGFLCHKLLRERGLVSYGSITHASVCIPPRL